MAIKLGKSAPWIDFYHEVKALFDEDPDVNVIYDYDNYEVTLYVEDSKKADALSNILPKSKQFGDVIIKLSVVPANSLKKSKLSSFEEAFKGNNAVSYIKSVSGLFDMDYVVFKKKVVQYYNDDISDINGLCSTLYQTIAEHIFEDCSGVYFCTDKNDGCKSITVSGSNIFNNLTTSSN